MTYILALKIRLLQKLGHGIEPGDLIFSVVVPASLKSEVDRTAGRVVIATAVIPQLPQIFVVAPPLKTLAV